MIFSEDLIWTMVRGVTLAAVALLWVSILVRIVGLRAFSKMTAVDFVVTVATGSLLAGAAQATSGTGLVQACLAILGLLAAQWAIATARFKSDDVKNTIENTPRLLMRDGQIDETALAETRTARSDLIAKLREANVLSFGDVRAVVLEATGDISVLHGETLDEVLLEGVDRG